MILKLNFLTENCERLVLWVAK